MVQYAPKENRYIDLDIVFATEYGVNEALIFDKLHRLQKNWQGFTDENGDKWVRLTYEEWEKELPFLSRNTIRRTIENMTDELNLVFSTVFKGRSKWYRCNPEFVSAQNGQLPKMGNSSAQNGQLPNSLPKLPLSSTNVEDAAQKTTSQNDNQPIKEEKEQKAVSPPPDPAVSPPPVKPKNSRPAAVDIYRKVAHKFPDKTLWPMIDEKVGNKSEDLQLWEKVIFNYIACGWYKGSIKNMLGFFERKEIPGDKKPNYGGIKTNGSHQKNSESNLDKQPTFDPYTGETCYPDGRREKADLSCL